MFYLGPRTEVFWDATGIWPFPDSMGVLAIRALQIRALDSLETPAL